jgi:hypothetical protein
MRPDQDLIFVYNCDRGNLSAIRDYSQKQGSDTSPSCNLLNLISSPVGTKKGWKRFIGDLTIPSRFLHRDEFEEEFGALISPTPAVFFRRGKDLTLLIASEDLNRILSTDALIAFVNKKLQEMRE